MYDGTFGFLLVFRLETAVMVEASLAKADLNLLLATGLTTSRQNVKENAKFRMKNPTWRAARCARVDKRAAKLHDIPPNLSRVITEKIAFTQDEAEYGLPLIEDPIKVR